MLGVNQLGSHPWAARRLAGVLCLLLFTGCGDGATAPFAEPGLLSVSGAGEVRAAPDQARFTAAVQNDGTEAEAVQGENSERTGQLLAALRGAGVAPESLRTTGIRLTPVWSPRPRNADQDWQPEIIGYRAHNQIEVTTRDLPGVGELLAAAVRAGANDINGVHFTLEDDATARGQAIRIATHRALAEAHALAEAAGARPGNIRELRLDGHTARPLLQRAAMDMAETAQVPVEPGEITVNVQVTLVMTIE